MPVRLQIVITTLLAVVVAAGWLWVDGSRDPAESSRGKARRGGGTLVLVEPLELAEDRIVVRAVGTGNALKSATLHPSVSGEVIEIGFEADRRVEKSAVLVRLDDQHQRLAVRLAQVALRKAKRDVARLTKLAASGHASRASLDTAQTDLESASVRYAQAQADLADRTITAPFPGVIGMTNINIGDRVTDDTMIATLDDRSTILVDFNLPEDYASRVRLGDPVTVRPSTNPGRRIAGAIFATASRIEATSRSLRVRARIPNPDGSIRPGTSFEVELVFTGQPHPRVREIAVLWSRDGAYLWRANTMKAEKVFVKLVRRDGGRILVDGPLKAGDLIVVEGVQGLRTGQALDAKPFGVEDGAGSPARRKKGAHP
jgi:membrane fusion protein, multidrug efflux system